MSARCPVNNVAVSEPRKYGGRTRAERHAERQERLVRATLTVLAARGEATTMTQICAEAGLTERYFYESFTRRDEALVSALDLAAREIAEVAVAAVASQVTGGAADRVRAGLSAVIELAERDPDLARVMVLESTGNPALRKRRHELLTWFGRLGAQEAAGLFGDTAWPPARAELQACVFVAGYAELVGFWLLGEFDLTPATLVDLGTELFETLMRRAPPG